MKSWPSSGSAFPDRNTSVAGLHGLRYRNSMLRSRPTILLTGFGPFPRVPVNATSILVPRIAETAARSFPGLRIVAEILPTEWIAGPARAAELYAIHRPVLALHFGVSHRAAGFAIEARGRNRCAATLDAAGALPVSSCISTVGPEYLPSGLPATRLVERLRRRGIAAHLSRDAGGYLCNALMYRTLDLARRDGHPLRNGFVHLPATLVDPRHPARGPLASSPLSWAETIEGGIEIIATSLGRSPKPRDIRALPELGRSVSPSPSGWADASRST